MAIRERRVPDWTALRKALDDESPADEDRAVRTDDNAVRADATPTSVIRDATRALLEALTELSAALDDGDGPTPGKAARGGLRLRNRVRP
ncbi:hypothetical protein [Streptomyces sp. B93]|uniref:hypothetical protein n=1 Tax=Streptomyces sp. B93 TaxID=2824875 RepID=UPI001B37ECAA|nr:hypothetical protein [Streptomyces sp. B93]MBQ1091621.1 hypothetical protein [Streptomyces sp. B93]